MILALDINSVRTGFAFGDEGIPRSGAWVLPGAADLPRCAAILHNSIQSLIAVIPSKPRLVVIEAPLELIDREHGKRALFVAVALYGAAIAAAAGLHIPVKNAPIYDWRKYFVGNGRLPTEDAKRAALGRCKLFGWSVDSHDEAEACGIWAWAMSSDPKWSPRQKRVA